MTNRRNFVIGAAGAVLPARAASRDQRAELRESGPPASANGIVDVHAHMIMPRYMELLGKIGVKVTGYGRPGSAPPAPPAGIDSDDGVARRLELMDQAGVTRQILSPTYAPYVAEEAQGVEAAQLVNNIHAAWAKRHPDRFSAFVSLPLPHVDASLRELRRGMDELGMVGVSLQCFCLDRSIAEDQFLPIYQELHRRRGILFIHPCNNGICSPLVTEWGLNPSAGAVFEDTTAALHLIIKQIPHKCPDMKVIVPHFGGALPMLLDRLNNQLKLSIPDLPEPPSVTARRFWYDTVGHGSQPALLAAVKAFDADKLLPGSDFPFLLPFEAYPETFNYIRRAEIPVQAINRILFENARDLFGAEAVRNAVGPAPARTVA